MSKEKWIIITICVVAITLISTMLIYNSKINKVQRRYSIDLPKTSEVLYSYEDIGWFGDGATIANVIMSENDFNELYESLYTGKPNDLTDEELEEEITTNINTFLRTSSSDYWPNWDNDNRIITAKGNYYIFDFDLHTLIMIRIIM